MLRSNDEMYAASVQSTHDYRSSSIASASRVHRAIRDAEYGWLEDHVGVNLEILWEPNTTAGWTAMHYACAQDMPTEWWEWILVRAAAANTGRSAFLHKRNALGQSVFDIYFRTNFDPLPWQTERIKRRSESLLNAIKIVCKNSHLLEVLKLRIRQQAQVRQPEDSDESAREEEEAVVDAIWSFYQHLDSLCRAAAYGHLTHARTLDMVHFLAHCVGGCPRPLAKLLLQLSPGSSATEAACGRLPLHGWALHGSGSSCSERDEMMPFLLTTYPKAAKLPDPETGRLALHAALASGKSWHDLTPLFEANPDALSTLDPVTQLPPVALAALPHLNNKDAVAVRARKACAGQKDLISLWRLVPRKRKEQAITEARDAIESEHVTTVFLVLRAFPRALDLCGGKR